MTVRMRGTKLALVAVAAALLAGCGSGTSTQTGLAPLVGNTHVPTETTTPVVLARPAEASGPYKVVSVTDAGTLTVLRDGQEVTVRALGLQEVAEQPEDDKACFGSEAGAYAQQALADQEVWLEPDASLEKVDTKGHELAYVWLSETEMFDVKMLRDGYGVASTYHDATFPYQRAFDDAQREAQDAERGMWAADACGAVTDDTTVPTDDTTEPGYDSTEPTHGTTEPGYEEPTDEM